MSKKVLCGMVYIASNGTIQNQSSWSLSKLVALFWGFLNFIVMFFKTLISPDMNRHGERYTRDYRPGSGPPRPPTRRMGGFGSGSINSCGPGAGG